MPLDAAAPLAQLVTINTGLAGVQAVRTAPPESLSYQAEVYIGLRGFTVNRRTTGGSRTWEIRYLVAFLYAVGGAETAAEQAVAAWLPAFVRAIEEDPTLGGTVGTAATDGSLADTPEYQVITAEEARIYPVVVTCSQSETISPF